MSAPADASVAVASIPAVAGATVVTSGVRASGASVTLVSAVFALVHVCAIDAVAKYTLCRIYI